MSKFNIFMRRIWAVPIRDSRTFFLHYRQDVFEGMISKLAKSFVAAEMSLGFCGCLEKNPDLDLGRS